MNTFGSWPGGSCNAARSVMTGMFESWARTATGAASKPATAATNISLVLSDNLILAS
jgi:hypothetical protein